MIWNEDLTRRVQERLSHYGDYPLAIDGQVGPGTRNAVIRFKERNGLRARSYIGPLTLELLVGNDAIPAPEPEAIGDEPPWLTEARRLLGTREVAGKRSNPVIMRWASELDQWYSGDDVPWCGLFAAICYARGAPQEARPGNVLGAREWLKFGQAATFTRSGPLPLGGCAVLWRVSRSDWRGHVAPAITAWNETHFAAIGGNQGDNVTEAWFPRSRLLGVRTPTNHEPTNAPRAVTGSVSTSEA